MSLRANTKHAHEHIVQNTVALQDRMKYFAKICKFVPKLYWPCLHNSPPLLINWPAY